MRCVGPTAGRFVRLSDADDAFEPATPSPSPVPRPVYSREDEERAWARRRADLDDLAGMSERNATAHGGRRGSRRISSPARGTQSPNASPFTIYGTQPPLCEDLRSGASDTVKGAVSPGCAGGKSDSLEVMRPRRASGVGLWEGEPPDRFVVGGDPGVVVVGGETSASLAGDVAGDDLVGGGVDLGDEFAFTLCRGRVHICCAVQENAEL